jgi:hypothetical protein
MSKGGSLVLSTLLAAVTAQASSFTLGAVIEAGSASANELFAGASSGSPSVSGSVSPYWTDATNHAFSVSYNAATNTATVQAQTGAGTSSVSWVVAGGFTSSPVTTWTINAGGLAVIAANNTATNTQVRIRNLTLSGPGFATLSPPNQTANQNGGGAVTTGNAAPITFTTGAGLGNWVLNGEIRFLNLATAVSGGASGNQLRMAFDITAGTQVPEPATLPISAIGFAALGFLRRLRPRV